MDVKLNQTIFFKSVKLYIFLFLHF